MKSKIILLILCCYEINMEAQHFQLTPFFGNKLQYISTFGGQDLTQIPLSFSAMAGLELSDDRIPYQLRFHMDWATRTVTTLPRNLFGLTDLTTFYRAYNIEVTRSHKSWKFGLGYTHIKYENNVPFYFGWDAENHIGGYLVFMKQLDWLSVEYRPRFIIKPNFAALWAENHSLSFVYYLRKSPKTLKENSPYKFKFLIGAKLFSWTNEILLPTESRFKIGTALYYGLELMHQRWNTSVVLEKDIFVAINGGSPVRTLKSYINGTTLSLVYHIQLKNTHKLRVGTGVTVVQDPSVATDAFLLGYPTENVGRSYQFIGIVPTLSYELFKNTDIGVKVPLGLRYDNRIEDIINQKRIGLMINYRL